jgi:hypothetical protein
MEAAAEDEAESFDQIWCEGLLQWVAFTRILNLL